MMHAFFETTFYSINNDFPNRFLHFLDCIANEDVESGIVGYIDDAFCCEDRVYNFVVGKPVNDKQIVAVVSPPVHYENTISAGTPFRVFIPRENRIIMTNSFTFEESNRKFIDDIDVDANKVFVSVGDNGKLIASLNYTNDSIGYISSKISVH